MYSNDTRQKLENIIKGIISEEQSDNCTATRNFLCTGFSTNTTVKKDFEKQFQIKKEQGELLKHFITENNLWLSDLPDDKKFLTEGGEAKIYFGNDSKTVIKLNDAIYYSTWLDFFNSILIHNLLFPETLYNLLGFTNSTGELLAILNQPFIISDSATDLKDVKTLLNYNGFENTKRNDYYNKELGIILEDMHDENVIVNSNTLFFIDTVFYIHLTER